MIRRLVLVVLAGVLVPGFLGCSRQSVTDFTPYPASQGVVRLGSHAIPASFTLSDGVVVNLERLEIGMTSIGPVDETVGQKSASVLAHTHEEETTSTTDSTSGTATGDSNRESGDSRVLVPLGIPVGGFVNLLEERGYGDLALRADTTTAWKMRCEAYAHTLGTASLILTGTIASGGLISSLTAVIADPFEVTFDSGQKVPAVAVLNQEFGFHAATWFDGLGLSAAIGSGPILIDEEHAALHEGFLNNFRASIFVGAHDHAHE